MGSNLFKSTFEDIITEDRLVAGYRYISDETNKGFGNLALKITYVVVIGYGTKFIKDLLKTETFYRKWAIHYVIKKRFSIIEDSGYIERKVEEKKINSLIGNTNDKKYVIIIGEKGTGKTSLIEHCINGKIGIIKIDIDKDTKNLRESLLLSIGIPSLDWNKNKELDIFTDLCKSAGTETWTPTVIFDIKGNTDPDIIDSVCSTSKKLSHERKAARCIIVISEHNLELSIKNGTFFINFRCHKTIIY
jgi:hypothetical protein